MKQHHTAAYAVVCLLLTGCATAGVSTARIAPPPATSVRNDLTVARSFDDVWDNLVSRLSRGFYIINNIEKASHLINLSFSSDAPQSFIDCGTTTRTYERKGQQTQTFRYPVAASSEYLTGAKVKGFPVIYHVRRKTSLEGRVNVYVAPLDSTSTRVSVNARYVLSVATTGVYEEENYVGTVIKTGSIDPQHATISFNTNQPNEVNWGTEADPQEVTCRSTGALEGEILGFAQTPQSAK